MSRQPGTPMPLPRPARWLRATQPASPLAGAHYLQRGFSLIEVLAAMVIFSAGAVILFGWISQTASRMGKLSTEQQSLFGEMTGLEFARTLNPMLQPEGDTAINGIRIRWTARPVGDESATRAGGGEGNYIVRLYQLAVVTETDKTEPATRSIYLAGWRERANAAVPIPFLIERSQNAPR